MELTEYEEALIKVIHTLTIIYSPEVGEKDKYQTWYEFFVGHPMKVTPKGLTPIQLKACTEDLCYLRDWLVKKIDEEKEKKRDGEI